MQDAAPELSLLVYNLPVTYIQDLFNAGRQPFHSHFSLKKREHNAHHAVILVMKNPPFGWMNFPPIQLSIYVAQGFPAMLDDTPPGILRDVRIPAGDAAAPLVPNKLLGKNRLFWGSSQNWYPISCPMGMVTMALGLPKQ